MTYMLIREFVFRINKDVPYYFRTTVPAGVLKAGLSLLMGSVSETGVFNLERKTGTNKSHIIFKLTFINVTF